MHSLLVSPGASRRPGALSKLAAAVALAAVLTPAYASAAAPRIVSPKESYLGLGYGDWAALWWQWVFSIPDGPTHPFYVGGNVLQNQAGHVWFLVGTFGPDVRNISVPSGTSLFFPIGNAECSTLEPEPFHGDDAPELSDCANFYADQVVDQAPTCEIDGKSVHALAQYRTQSPSFTFGPLPDPALYGLTPGATGQAVDAGLYILLEPLSVGAHSIHFTAYNGAVDTRYNITVQP